MRASVMREGISLFDRDRPGAGSPETGPGPWGAKYAKPMPPASGEAKLRMNIVARETLPGAKDHQAKRYKNAVDLEKLSEERESAEKEWERLKEAEIGGNLGVGALRRLRQEMDRINGRRRSTLDAIGQLEREREQIENSVDPNIGEVRVDANKRPTIYLNRTAMGLLSRVVREGKEGMARGMALTREQAKNLRDRLAETAVQGDEEKVLEPVTRLLDAAIDHGYGGIAVLGKLGEGVKSAVGTLREEWLHRWQMDRSENGLTETHLSGDAFVRLFAEMPNAAYDHLRDNQYDFEPRVYVIETAAKIMAGKADTMGLTEDQAVRWLIRYFEEVDQQHGTEAVMEIDHTAGIARRLQKEWETPHGPGNEPEAKPKTKPQTGPGTAGTAGEKPDARRPLSSLEGRRGGEAPRGTAQGEAGGINSPAFKRWFGASKVVDESGKPRIVYHGTRAAEDFTEFSTEGHPGDEDGESIITGSDATAFMGAHFAQEPHVANQFAAGSDWMKSRYWGDEEKPRVMPVYLSIENPKIFDSEQELRDLIYDGKIRDESLLEDAMAHQGIDPFEDEEKAQEWYRQYDEDPESRRIINEAILSRSPEGMEEVVHDARAELGREARSTLEAWGHDGVRYKNEVEGGTSWIAFDPGQIKSATGNAGTWDPDSPNILKDLERRGHKPEPGDSTVEESVEQLAKRVVDAHVAAHPHMQNSGEVFLFNREIPDAIARTDVNPSTPGLKQAVKAEVARRNKERVRPEPQPEEDAHDEEERTIERLDEEIDYWKRTVEAPLRSLQAELQKRKIPFRVSGPDFGSKYLVIDTPEDSEIQIRFSDHAQPRGIRGKVRGGFNESGEEHEASDLSLDPETPHTVEDALNLIESRLNETAGRK